jgi:hypothetical protein
MSQNYHSNSNLSLYEPILLLAGRPVNHPLSQHGIRKRRGGGDFVRRGKGLKPSGISF